MQVLPDEDGTQERKLPVLCGNPVPFGENHIRKRVFSVVDRPILFFYSTLSEHREERFWRMFSRHSFVFLPWERKAVRPASDRREYRNLFLSVDCLYAGL